MAQTLTTKPDKISAKLITLKSLGRSGTVHDVVLDLFRGFSTRICLDIWNGEEKNFKYYFPAFVKVKVGSNFDSWRYDIDLGRALQMGLLEVADDNDRAVSVKPVERELEALCVIFQEAEPINIDIHPIKTINARLLSHLRRCLLPGKQYKLRFCGPRFTIWSKFGKIESTDKTSITPLEWPEDSRVQMICNPQPVLFTVKAGVRIPRFTVSFSTSSSTCYLDEPHKFFVTLTVTSLEDQPVTVALLFDRIATEIYPDEWGAKSSLDVFEIHDEDAGNLRILKCDIGHAREPSMKRAAMLLFQFNKGTSYIRNVHFPREPGFGLSWADYSSGSTIKMASRAGFVAWDYGYAHKLQETHTNREDWTKHGPIQLEPVSAVALTIKAVFEREIPKPFFSLPLELRDQVYEYLRWSERADEARFTAKDGREPCAIGVAGAVRSG